MNKSEFLDCLVLCSNTACDRLPSLSDLSQQLGVSIATLREQMEVARALGLIEVRPNTGIGRLPYTFRPAVRQSLAYATKVQPENFQAYSDLRNHLETAYWSQAVNSLSAEDHQKLRELVKRAKEKLNAHPAQVPHAEHRELHLTIYSHLDNPFVTGLLEAYWELYEEMGLNMVTDLGYLQRVWQYHEKMVEDICAGNYESGNTVLMDQAALLSQRPKQPRNQKFE